MLQNGNFAKITQQIQSMNLYNFELTAGSREGSKNHPKVNAHIHTPHSYSAFTDIEQPFMMAQTEGISVLGINDFYTTDGYPEFAVLAKKYRIFPLFNIEFMALQKEEQQANIRINDPQNPGRTYLSGKGLQYPTKMSEASAAILQKVQQESNLQTFAMIEKLNLHLQQSGINIHLEAGKIKNDLARNLLRERHIATALRQEMEILATDPTVRKQLYTQLFSGITPVSDTMNHAALENEIRNRMLKAGGPAYVAENEQAFLSLNEVMELIIDAGGIPCYPVLLDDNAGNYTDFEANFEAMANTLAEKNIFMVELIPGRNDFEAVKRFVHYFSDRNFTITFGTEHNTPLLEELTVSCRGKVPLDSALTEENARGAAIIAAHQYLTQRGLPGFPVKTQPTKERFAELESIGRQVIDQFTNQ